MSILFATAGKPNEMLWRRRKPAWFIDPSNVAFGSVFEKGSRNLSRSHVKVKYHQGSEARFIPLATFGQRSREILRSSHGLGSRHPSCFRITAQAAAPDVSRLINRLAKRFAEATPSGTAELEVS